MELLINILRAVGMLQCVLAIAVFTVAKTLGYWDKLWDEIWRKDDQPVGHDRSYR